MSINKFINKFIFIKFTYFNCPFNAARKINFIEFMSKHCVSLDFSLFSQKYFPIEIDFIFIFKNTEKKIIIIRILLIRQIS